METSRILATMAMIEAKTAVFAGCARDCEPFLGRVLENVANAASQFADAGFVFVENDSVDQTVSQLHAFGRKHSRFVLERLDGLADRRRLRTVRLAEARNRYLAVIRESTLRDFDYLFVFDMDNANCAGQSLEQIVRAISFLESNAEHAGVFANQTGIYHDMWALRHPTICPGDVWEEVFDYALTRGVADEVAFNATMGRRIFSLDCSSAPVEVESAFGGLGIYRMSSVLEGGYCGSRSKTVHADGRTAHLLWQTCEHVSLHADIRRRKQRLFIAPWLINRHYMPGFPPFPPSAFRSMYETVKID